MPDADISPTRPDKIFAIALGVVAVLGAAEIAGVAVHYIRRAREQYVAAHPQVTAPPKATAAPIEKTAAVAPVAAQSPATAASTADRLLKEATALREKGDTTNALARLQDAAQRDPKNAEVLATMAMIYETIQLFERSNETWRKIQEIGPTAGTFYDLADSKLKSGAAAPGTTTTDPGTAVAPLDAGTIRLDADGIADGATFGITELRATNTPDADSETMMKLRIAVKSRPNAVIDHTKVKIQVFFYDSLDNNEPILTDADVSYEWVTPHHDWKTTDTEVLSVTYVRPTNKPISADAALSAAAAAVTPSGGKKKSAPKEPADPPAEEGPRKYLGYIVRIYYNDQLQTVRADPPMLLKRFPPPLTAPQ